MVICKYESVIHLWQPQVKSTKHVLSIFDTKKYFPDGPEIMDPLQKQFHCKWMYTFTYVGIILQNCKWFSSKESVYKFLLKL